MPAARLSVVVAALTLTFDVAADINVAVTPPNGGLFTIGPLVDGRRTVDLERDPLISGAVTFAVTGLATDHVGQMTVATNDAAGATNVSVRGPAAGQSIGPVDSIGTSGSGRVVVTQLRTIADLGVVNVDEILLARIGGNASGLQSRSGGILDTVITGNLVGGVTVTGGQLDLMVTGSIGASGAPASVIVQGDVLRLEAANVTASISVSGAIQTFRVIGTPGNFSGTLYAGRLAAAGGSAVPQFFVAGAVFAPVTVDQNVSVPITAGLGGGSATGIAIGGDLTSAATFTTMEIDLSVAGRLTGSLSLPGDTLHTGPVTLGGVASTGSINVDGTCGLTLRIQGDVAAGAVINLMRSVYGGAGSIVILGPVNGDINVGSSTLYPGGNIHGRLEIHNDLAGAIRVRDYFTGNGGSITGTLRINGRLLNSGSIVADRSLSASGHLIIGGESAASQQSLRGQVIINRLNMGATWDGEVVVDGQTLDGPYYTAPSSELGGGAVGLAPFAVYGADCTPPSGAYRFRTQFETPGSAGGALVRFYGPVEMDPDPDAPLPIVEKRSPENENVWGSVAPMFSVVVNPDGDPRAVRVRYVGMPGRLAPGLYRLNLAGSGLRCRGVLANPAILEDSVYSFNIALDCNHNGTADEADFSSSTSGAAALDCDINGLLDGCDLEYDGFFRDTNHNGVLDACEAPCPCDWNSSGGVNSQDFFDFLNAFFAGAADYNRDSVTNSQDFFDFLNCFFNGCA